MNATPATIEAARTNETLMQGIVAACAMAAQVCAKLDEEKQQGDTGEERAEERAAA